MLRSFRHQLCDLKVQASDGLIAEVNDVYFDEAEWHVRYLATGTWLDGRRVILPSAGLHSETWRGKVIETGLSKGQVRTSPDIGPDPPTRAQEKDLAEHYEWPAFGEVIPHGVEVPADRIVQHSRRQARESDSRLRSLAVVIGYPVEATDGEIGKIDDFIVDDKDWMLRYAIVHTGVFPQARRTLVPLETFLPIDLDAAVFRVNVPGETIKHGPTYRGGAPDRTFESKIYDHYHRPAYWEAA